MEKAKSITSFVAVVSYLAFPVFSGAWFHDRIECVYMWSEAVKNGFSIAAYLATGAFLWKKFRPDVVSEDGIAVLYIVAIFMGVVFFGNVIHKCW